MFLGERVALLLCTGLPAACEWNSHTDRYRYTTLDDSGICFCWIYEVHWHHMCQGILCCTI